MSKNVKTSNVTIRNTSKQKQGKHELQLLEEKLQNNVKEKGLFSQ